MSLHTLSAQDIAAQIKAKKISAQDALTYFITRIEKHNPTLNAVVATRFDEASADAKKADEKQARGERKRTRLNPSHRQQPRLPSSA